MKWSEDRDKRLRELYWHGRSASEIAARLGIPSEAIALARQIYAQGIERAARSKDDAA